jgi:TPM domain
MVYYRKARVPVVSVLLSVLCTSYSCAWMPFHYGSTGSSNVSRRNVLLQKFLGGGLIASTSLLMPILPAEARLESVNRPDLLPKDQGLKVIQTEKFLTSGQAKRMDQLLSALERDTGWRVRVLCQAYPNTPGLAIRDYWDLGKEGQKDDKYVVLVVDEFGGKGNVLNFNVGDGTKLALPNIFWTRLQAKYGNTFYVRDNGIDLAITNAIEAIVSCLKSEDQYCVSVPDEAPSLKSLGMA